MPEAAVNEDSDARAGENDVGPPGRRCRVHPVTQTGPPKRPAKRHLRAVFRLRIRAICSDRLSPIMRA